MALEVGELHIAVPIPGINLPDLRFVGGQDGTVETLVGRAVIRVLIPFLDKVGIHGSVTVAAGGVRIAVLVRGLGGITEAKPFREAVVAVAGVREMDAPDGLLAVVAHPVQILVAGPGIEVDIILEAAGPFVGVHPDFTLVVLQVEFGDAGVRAVLQPGDHLGLGDTHHVGFLVEARVEQPHTAHQRLGGILGGTAGQVVVPGVAVFGGNHVDGRDEVVADRLVDLVHRSLGHVLHFGRQRQREAFIPLGHFPEPESAHEVRLAQVPVLVVTREKVVVHGGNGLQREVATENTIVVALPRGVVLVHGRGQQAVRRGRFLGARGAAAVQVVTGDHAAEQVDPEDTAAVQGMHRGVGRVDQLLRVLLRLGEGGGIGFLIVLRVQQAVDLVAAGNREDTGNQDVYNLFHMLSELEFDADAGHIDLRRRIETGVDAGRPAVTGGAGTDFRIHAVIAGDREEVLSRHENAEHLERKALEHLLEVIAQGDVADLDVIGILDEDVAVVAVALEVVVRTGGEARELVGGTLAGPVAGDQVVGEVLEVLEGELAVALHHLLAEGA